MKFGNPKAGILGLFIVHVSAGWIVNRYRPDVDEIDMLAGAFREVDDAIESARAIIRKELDELQAALTQSKEEAA